ncbi:unnamed protein product [Musa hybrid cultivar]
MVDSQYLEGLLKSYFHSWTAEETSFDHWMESACGCKKA